MVQTVSASTNQDLSLLLMKIQQQLTELESLLPASLSTSVAPKITTQPVNQTVVDGQTATFNVVASGTTPLTYQWKKNEVVISGATSDSYTTPVTVVSDNNAKFTVTVSNGAGSITSAEATLEVHPVAPSITTQPANQTVIVGAAASFAVVASGTSPLNYQWKKNGADISGATLSSYTTGTTTVSDNNSKFTVVVSNSAGKADSSPATLTVTVSAKSSTSSTPSTSSISTPSATPTTSPSASGSTTTSTKAQSTSTNTTTTPTSTSMLPSTSGSATTSVVTQPTSTNITSTDTTTTPSSDATLSDLTVDGVTLPDFSQDQFVYLVTLPSGTTNIPIVAAAANDSNAMVTVSQAQNIASVDTGIGADSQALVSVIAQDGNTQEDYAVVFYAQPVAPSVDLLNVGDTTQTTDQSQSTDTSALPTDTAAATTPDLTLQDLTVDGKTVDNFGADVLDYSISLPQDTASVPVVNAIVHDSSATVTIFQADSGFLKSPNNTGGIAVVEVVSQDGSTTQNYVIHFTIEKPAVLRPANTKALQSTATETPALNNQPQSWCHDFNFNFGYNSHGPEVVALHTLLNDQNISYGKDKEDVYGESTRAAVSQLQENYASDILSPLGLINGTGYVGIATREYLNSLYGCN